MILGFGNYCHDSRTTANHFILSEIDAPFLREHEIHMTINAFKEFCKTQEPDFTTLCGKDFGECKRVKVYNIKQIKKVLEKTHDKSIL